MAIAPSSRAPSPTLSEEEALDLADPLRHLRGSDHPHSQSKSSSDDATFLPEQPHSIQNETISLSFPAGSGKTISNGEPSRPISIKLAVDASPGCGGIAWPAGEVLARHIARRADPSSDGASFGSTKSPLANINVLELGSGTGLVGLVAALLGAKHVWITDQTPLLPIMQRNIELNGLQDRVTASELNWGEPLPPSIPHPQLILAADCVYFEPAFPLLVQTLAYLIPATKLEQGEDPEVLFCYKKRRKADKRFFALLKKHFTWSDVEDPEHANYTRDSISLLRLHRKR
ncbi:uncharacterized protein STEHIDRAFT_95156 [Stereum hirsutum FP-91666 SS1]|uniref:uncharacterized protein n=1 Tax=Stereum hirsutum (strain FP-91666) TaxID=721885 RepID=UPI000440E6DE|nr:uncharacterized protein STEHIDRAFT_95156 [Stereum hirsutum FP-91666 SS1]EIM88167.1 hypothetical protein STEHIDRAFT_95156 [Stereum hirsutum FP-91666 SS1]